MVRRGVARLAETFGRLPLRVYLVVGLMVLLAGGLTGTWLVSSAVMERYLLSQLDDRLERTSLAFTRFAGTTADGLPRVPRGGPIQPGTYLVLARVDGRTITLQSSPTESGTPALPVTLTPDVPTTVPSIGDHGPNWRVLATPATNRTTLVITAADQHEIDDAVRELRHRFLLISAGALGLMGLFGYLLVRGGLRPLEEVEQTAEMIAAGDLTQRVPVRRPGSEVGRLASAFNAMIGRIESAFHTSSASEAAARGSEERMRRFVADASHELRTPLTSIRGYAELYRQGAVTKPTEVAAVLRRIEDQAARMGLLVDDLLLLARLDQQRPLEREPVDLAVLAVDAVSDAHAVDPDRPVTLKLPDHEVTVPGDELRLRQVLGNLVSNAQRHTPPDTPVEIRLRTTADHALLEVADTGPGLPPEVAERVFERFFRADAARTTENGSTGLGLAIVHAIVLAHGGHVALTTTPGHGATFTVHLPLR